MTSTRVQHTEEVSKSKLADFTLASVPEAAFSTEGISQIDMLNCVLIRAQGIMSALQSAGEGEEFYIHHDNVMAALWAVDGLIQEAKQTVGSINRR